MPPQRLTPTVSHSTSNHRGRGKIYKILIEHPREAPSGEGSQVRTQDEAHTIGSTWVGQENQEGRSPDNEGAPKQGNINQERHDLYNRDTTPWEAQVGWHYIGHGEWVQVDTSEHNMGHGNALEKEPDWVKKWLASHDPDIKQHHEVKTKGYPNRWGAKIKVKSRWNLDLLEDLLTGYEDQDIVEWLKYVWPTGRLPTLPEPQKAGKNHKGAAEFLEHLDKYIAKEAQYQAVMGPYNKIPFADNTGILPLSTRPKEGSSDRRIILDLSFPIGGAVNDGIPKDSYMGFKAQLTFPKTDQLALRIFQLGLGCYLFKIDLSRYFRQIPLDLGDFSLIGYVINGKIYFDKILPMGMRLAPYIAQKITNAIAHIHQSLQYFLLNYVDDFVGAELWEKIWDAYNALSHLLQNLGVETSQDKIVPPTTRLEFLGITFDAQTMTMEISADKLKEIKQELKGWLLKTSAKRREIESLVGKLQFMAKCVRAGRIFLGRLIQWIRKMDRRFQYTIPLEAGKDIAWWARFLQEYNGVSLLWLIKEPEADTALQTDACPKGFGGICGEEYFRGRFPEEHRCKNIAILEMWAVMVGLKIWGHLLKGKYFWVHVDNEAVASVLNTGSSREPELQNSLREIALIAARHQFVIKAKHISGVSNRIPDWLSRWHEPAARKEFRKVAHDSSLKQVRIKNQLLQYTHEW